MTYIDHLAEGLRRQIPQELLPDEDATVLLRLYVVLALAKGVAVTPGDVHDAWAVWMAERDPYHPSLRPFDELDPETRASDSPFVDAMRRFAKNFSDG